MNQQPDKDNPYHSKQLRGQNYRLLCEFRGIPHDENLPERNKAQSFNNVLKRILPKLANPNADTLFKIQDNWDKIIGSRYASRAKADKIYKNKLYIRINGITLRQELQFTKRDIVKKVAKTIGNPKAITDLVFF